MGEFGGDLTLFLLDVVEDEGVACFFFAAPFIGVFFFVPFGGAGDVATFKHLLRRHFFFSLPWPPYFFISLHILQIVQSVAVQPEQLH